MARDEHPSGGKVKAPVPLVIRGVSEEDTESGAGVKLVGRSGSGVGVTRTPKDVKVIVPRRGTKKGVVWCRTGTSSGRKTVEEVGGGVQALSLEAS
jgi:YbbR domain-containing protein